MMGKSASERYTGEYARVVIALLRSCTARRAPRGGGKRDGMREFWISGLCCTVRCTPVCDENSLCECVENAVICWDKWGATQSYRKVMRGNEVAIWI